MPSICLLITQFSGGQIAVEYAELLKQQLEDDSKDSNVRAGLENLV
jgi:hypothetical protein